MKAREKILTVVCLVLVFFAVQALASGPLAASLESESVSPLAFEGNSNTFYGTEAGNSTAGDNHGDTFIGYRAGYSNTTGNFNSFIGSSAGLSNTTGDGNSFLGFEAGYSNTTGNSNSFLGYGAGYSNTTANSNSFLGSVAGYSNTTGAGNVFLGYRVGYNEIGSNKLYIDNSDTSSPLIYGEFDTNRLTINGNLQVIGPDNGVVRLSNVTTNNTTKGARMVLNHYSNAQLPVYLFGAASTAAANFVPFGGGNTIGNAATQLDFFTAPNTTTPAGTSRLTIIGNGNVGIGTQTPAQPLQMASGAHVTAGGAWTNASSREYKDDIQALGLEEAFSTLRGLHPVKFAYKADRTERHAGFVAEEVPDLVATKDRKGLSPMDIVAVLTKVVQEQQRMIKEQKERFEEQISNLTQELREIKRERGVSGSLAMSGLSSDR